MQNKNISIFYLSLGSGHQVAAEALAGAIKQERPDLPVIIEDPFANTIEILPSVLSALQAVSILLTPNIYDLAWRRKAGYDSYQWITDIGLLQDFLIERISSRSIYAVVATQALPCILAVGLRKRMQIQKVYGVITDFGTHSFWPTEGVDGYFVANDELKNTMTYMGIKASSIHVTGIPIKKAFQTTAVKAARKKTRMLFVAGGLRSGSYTGLRRYFIEILDTLIARDFKNIDITIVAGNQKQLRKDLLGYQQKTKFDFRVLGYVHDMPRLMMTNDILITKPGGLIVSEALASGMCIILSHPGPGQETANADFLARHGVAYNGETPGEVVNIIQSLLEDPKLIVEMKMKAKKLGFPNSAESVAKIILDNLVM